MGTTMMPGTPNPSIVAEGFMDTPIINGAAYPVLTVEPKAYRFRILNAANDRFLNLQLYKAASNDPMWNPDGTCLTQVLVKSTWCQPWILLCVIPQHLLYLQPGQ